MKSSKTPWVSTQSNIPEFYCQGLYYGSFFVLRKHCKNLILLNTSCKLSVCLGHFGLYGFRCGLFFLVSLCLHRICSGVMVTTGILVWHGLRQYKLTDIIRLYEICLFRIKIPLRCICHLPVIESPYLSVTVFPFHRRESGRTTKYLVKWIHTQSEWCVLNWKCLYQTYFTKCTCLNH